MTMESREIRSSEEGGGRGTNRIPVGHTWESFGATVPNNINIGIEPIQNMYRPCPVCGTEIEQFNLIGDGYCPDCRKWVPIGPPIPQDGGVGVILGGDVEKVPTARMMGPHSGGAFDELPTGSFSHHSHSQDPPFLSYPIPLPGSNAYYSWRGQHPQDHYLLNYGLGYYQRDDEDLVRRLSVYGLILFYLTMISNFIALVYAIFVVPGEIVNESELKLLFLVPIPPFLRSVGFNVGGSGLVIYFLFLVASILVSIEVMLIRDGRSFDDLSRKLLSNQHLDDAEKREFDRNGFVLLGELFMAVLFFNACYVILLMLFHIEMETPNFDEWETWELMFAFARASVWEEVVSRIIYIGLPLFLIYVILGFDHSEVTDSDRAVNEGRRKGAWYRHLLGGNLRITPLSGLLILFSSLLFGLAHLSSWDVYKVIPVIVGGMALGYLFVKKGVHVSIMLHFAIDYLSVLPSVLDERSGLALQMAIGFLIVIMFSMGAYMFYKYLIQFISYVYYLMTGGAFVREGEENWMGEGGTNVDGGQDGAGEGWDADQVRGEDWGLGPGQDGWSDDHEKGENWTRGQRGEWRGGQERVDDPGFRENGVCSTEEREPVYDALTVGDREINNSGMRDQDSYHRKMKSQTTERNR